MIPKESWLSYINSKTELKRCKNSQKKSSNDDGWSKQSRFKAKFLKNATLKGIKHPKMIHQRILKESLVIHDGLKEGKRRIKQVKRTRYQLTNEPRLVEVNAEEEEDEQQIVSSPPPPPPPPPSFAFFHSPLLLHLLLLSIHLVIFFHPLLWRFIGRPSLCEFQCCWVDVVLTIWIHSEQLHIRLKLNFAARVCFITFSSTSAKVRRAKQWPKNPKNPTKIGRILANPKRIPRNPKSFF